MANLPNTYGSFINEGVNCTPLVVPTADSIPAFAGSSQSIRAYARGDIHTVSLDATDWDTTTNTITVDVTGVTATSNQEILPLPATSAANIANNKALQACNLMDYGQAEGQITLYAENIPSVDLSIRVIVRA